MPAPRPDTASGCIASRARCRPSATASPRTEWARLRWSLARSGRPEQACGGRPGLRGDLNGCNRPTRLPGRARLRACHGQAGAARICRRTNRAGSCGEGGELSEGISRILRSRSAAPAPFPAAGRASYPAPVMDPEDDPLETSPPLSAPASSPASCSRPTSSAASRPTTARPPRHPFASPCRLRHHRRPARHPAPARAARGRPRASRWTPSAARSSSASPSASTSRLDLRPGCLHRETALEAEPPAILGDVMLWTGTRPPAANPAPMARPPAASSRPARSASSRPGTPIRATAGCPPTPPTPRSSRRPRRLDRRRGSPPGDSPRALHLPDRPRPSDLVDNAVRPFIFLPGKWPTADRP